MPGVFPRASRTRLIAHHRAAKNDLITNDFQLHRQRRVRRKHQRHNQDEERTGQGHPSGKLTEQQQAT